MSKLIIFGEGHYADQAYYYFTNDSPYEVVAFTADAAYITKKALCGKPVLPFEEIEKNSRPKNTKCLWP
jgi:FlaA1/EpsC-like NDP-sugar epimerase